MAKSTGGERFLVFDEQPEAVPGEMNSSITFRGIRVTDNGAVANGNKQTLDVTEQANVTSQPAPVFQNMAPSASINVIPSPYRGEANSFEISGSAIGCLRRMLDWFHIRGVTYSGELDPHSIEITQDGILTEQLTSCKPNTFSLTIANGQFPELSMELLARTIGRRSTVRTIGSIGFPTSRHWNIRNILFFVGDELTANTSGDVLAPNARVESVTINGSNNLTPGPIQRHYPDTQSHNEALRAGVSELNEGQLEITGSIVLRLEDSTWFDRFIEENGDRGSIRILGFHEDSESTTLAADLTTDPASNPTIGFTDASDFAVGDVVYIEDRDGGFAPSNWRGEVLTIDTILSNNVTLETGAADALAESYGRNQVLSAGSQVWTNGLSFRLPRIQLTGHQIIGGANDTVQVQCDFRAEVGLDSGYVTAPPAGFNFYPMKWNVR